MIWNEIKDDLDRVLSGADPVNRLIDRDEFWKSGKRFVLRAASYLHEHGKSSECLSVIAAVKMHGCALSQKVVMGLQYLCGDALLSIEKYPEAVAAYSEILAMETSDVAYANRALAYWEIGSHQKALSDYLEAIKLNPQNKVALRGAGEMLNEMDRHREAVRYLSAAVKLDPEYAAAYTALGVAYYNSEEWQKSYRALKRALQLNPEDKIAAKGVAKIEHHFELDKLDLE
jgi:tetratricopeptide (TPR) repeat protein